MCHFIWNEDKYSDSVSMEDSSERIVDREKCRKTVAEDVQLQVRLFRKIGRHDI
jgi:hypothetical protein